MPNNNGLITAPVGFGDTQASTNTGERDLGKIIVNANINKWAKYKPVRYPRLFTDNIPNWWKSIDLNCGINIPVYDNNALMQMILDIKAGREMYNYIRPSGTIISPFRTTDFNNYNHKAKAPIWADTIDSIYALDKLYMPVIMNAPTMAGTELSITDLYGSLINNFYFGVAMVPVISSAIYYMTADQPIIGTVGRVDFELKYLPGPGYYDVFQFLAQRAKPTINGEDTPENTFVPVPAEKYMQRVQIINSSTLEIDLSAISSGGTISVALRITNNLSTVANFTNCTIQFRYYDSDPNDIYQLGEGVRAIQNFSINAGGGFYQKILPETEFLPLIDRIPGYVYFTGTLNGNEVWNSRGEIEK